MIDEYGQVERPLPGGNVGGAVRVGDTVRRPTGPWTPAVHALLRHLDGRLPHVPRVLGIDGRHRECLTYLPGRVLGDEPMTPGQITSLVTWTRQLHEATAGFWHPGPWRMFPVPGATVISHNDIAPYNACYRDGDSGDRDDCGDSGDRDDGDDRDRGDDLVGVFDWDLAGPTSPLLELGFIAWNAVPLWNCDLSAQDAARRLELIAAGYPGHDPHVILDAVPVRVRIMLDGIPVAAAAGDLGMVNLMAVGEPVRSELSLAGLVGRIPAIHRALG